MARMLLPHGGDRIEFVLPDENLSDVLTPKDVDRLPDPSSEIHRARADPIGSPPLAESARSGGRVVITCDDNTRLTPANLIVPELLDERRDGGIGAGSVRVVIASGTHRLMSRSE